MLKVVISILAFTFTSLAELPRPIEMGRNTYELMLNSFSEIDIFARDAIIQTIHCAEDQNLSDRGEVRPLATDVNKQDEELLDLYLVRDQNTQSVVVAIAKINRGELENMIFKYRSAEAGSDQTVHHGTLKIGDVVETTGQVQFNETSMALQTDNDVTTATLYEGETIRITNFQGFTLDTQVDITDVRSGQLLILGRSGFAMNINTHDRGTLEMARLKFDVGVGSGPNMNRSRGAAVESVLMLELNFN